MSPGVRPSRASESIEDMTRSTVAITSIETTKKTAVRFLRQFDRSILLGSLWNELVDAVASQKVLPIDEGDERL